MFSWGRSTCIMTPIYCVTCCSFNVFMPFAESTVINGSLRQNIDLRAVTVVHFTLATQTHFLY
ncbi:hypothetical protein M405DRAFT_10193 [Rhizopogon salebrosus TDB-379]|nr:hypothetical protein M405DRAFT_10193 [Rhizopogon salebrosus TDB-379]